MATKNINRKKVKKLETTTLRKGFELGTNVNGINILKNQRFFFPNFEKLQRSQNTIKNLLLMIKKLQNKRIF